jgi:hypothetical protein
MVHKIAAANLCTHSPNTGRDSKLKTQPPQKPAKKKSKGKERTTVGKKEEQNNETSQECRRETSNQLY